MTMSPNYDKARHRLAVALWHMGNSLTREVIDLAARLMRGIATDKNLTCHAIAGVPREGNAFAKVLSRLSGIPCIEIEDLGIQSLYRLISFRRSVPRSVLKVMLVDGIILETGTTNASIDLLREEGIEVVDVMTLIDIEHGARERLAKMGCQLHSVFTATELSVVYSHIRNVQPLPCIRVQNNTAIQ
jgi:orotate phosphoribosyltransferase